MNHLSQRVRLVIERADGHRSEADVGGEACTKAILQAAEELLFAINTGMRHAEKTNGGKVS